ncbi:cleavage and polyadenylation specificity factor A subunit protein [Striga asiatica]|uniref:Cleavage and polyadenylation specificity factor A subunit protein n=1 Tax=Striga asiatica TaxID=4170 RepID=A0A5A7PSW6_STRAF|nr:cleavage and polyadenylation specificity factor A subunit protein [Striga asiatica]
MQLNPTCRAAPLCLLRRHLLPLDTPSLAPAANVEGPISPRIEANDIAQAERVGGEAFIIEEYRPIVQENYYWLERIFNSYQSRIYSGDVSASFHVLYYLLFQYK